MHTQNTHAHTNTRVDTKYKITRKLHAPTKCTSTDMHAHAHTHTHTLFRMRFDCYISIPPLIYDTHKTHMHTQSMHTQNTHAHTKHPCTHKTHMYTQNTHSTHAHTGTRVSQNTC